MARSAGGVLVLDDRSNRAMFTNDPPVAVWPIDGRQNESPQRRSHVVVHSASTLALSRAVARLQQSEVCPISFEEGMFWSNA